MDTEKQRQRRHDDARLAESGNARSEQLLVMPTELLTNRKWLPGELWSGLVFRYEISDLLLLVMKTLKVEWYIVIKAYKFDFFFPP